MLYRLLVIVLGATGLVSLGAQAHEYWVEPVAHVVRAGDTVAANLRVGQDYSGTTYPYLPSRLEQFAVTNADGRADIEGTTGDVPAASLKNLPEGLQIITYVSTVDVLDFDDWELFKSYVTYEGNAWAIGAHQDARLPLTGFSEAYRRNAKALVQVGAAQEGRDVDRAVGMRLELVAGQSPYLLAPGQEVMPVQLLWQGRPMAHQQINIFHRADTTSPRRHVMTGPDGRALVPVGQKGRYLLNAVRMELNGVGADQPWHSEWASLTFEIGAVAGAVE